jgi:hypothetical protein
VINLLIGASVAFCARIQIRTSQRPMFSSRYFTALMILEASIVVPIGWYFYAFYPDWSWMYLVNTSTSGIGISVMAIAMYPLAACMGYLIGYYSARGSSDWVTLVFMVFLLLGLVGLFGVAADKVFWIGTYDQFHRDVSLKGFASTSLLSSTLLSLSGLGVCWGYMLYRFVQEGRLSLRSF